MRLVESTAAAGQIGGARSNPASGAAFWLAFCGELGDLTKFGKISLFFDKNNSKLFQNVHIKY
jgi:hypothetical protein